MLILNLYPVSHLSIGAKIGEFIGTAICAIFPILICIHYTDLMHDPIHLLLEEVVPYEVKLSLNYCIC